MNLEKLRQLVRDKSFGEQMLRRLIGILPPALLILWCVGINVKEVSRVACGFLLLGVFWFRVIPKGGRLEPRITAAYTWFPAVFILLVASSQIARVYLGEHGIDFAIFTQVIRSVRDTGFPTTSLVAPNPVSFLSHHFAPFLFVVGWISRVSLEPHIIGIVLQSLSIGVAVFFFFRFCRVLGFSVSTASIGSTLLCLNSCFRSGVSWAIHDEVFGLGIVGAALYCWLTKRVLLASLCLLALGAFKETYFVAVALGAGIACLAAWNDEKKLSRAVLCYGIVSLLMTVASLFYFIIIPLYPEVFAMSFQPGARLTGLGSMLSLSFVAAKLRFLGYLLIPVFLLPLVSKPGLLLWFCAVPFWGASLLSNFPAMHLGLNYYAVVPTYVAFFASALTLRKRQGVTFEFTPLLLFVATCLAFSGGYFTNPTKPIRDLVSRKGIVPGSLTMIPQHLSVVASEFDSVFVLDKRRVVRLWIAERGPTSWDVILVRDGTKEVASRRILKGTKLCYEDPVWKVYCRPGVTLDAAGGKAPE